MGCGACIASSVDSAGGCVRYVGAFDRVYNPLLYRAFLFALRRRGGIE